MKIHARKDSQEMFSIIVKIRWKKFNIEQEVLVIKSQWTREVQGINLAIRFAWAILVALDFRV